MRWKTLKSGGPTETSIQEAVMEWIALHPLLSSLTLHIPNEGKRTSRFGAQLKKMGMMKGVADIFILYPCGAYHGMFIELKSANGKLSSEQTLFLNKAAAQGYCTAVCRSLDEAINAIRCYVELRSIR